MKKLRSMLCLLVCLGVTGCSKKVPDFSTSFMPTDLPLETVSSVEASNEEKIELFENIGFDKNNTLKLNKRFFNLYYKKDKSFTIEDRTYTQRGHKGKFDIHYPYFSGDEKKYEVINSIILAKIVETEGYGADETVRNDELHYEIETANDGIISILFSGSSYGQRAAHPINISFTINFDLEYDVPIYLYDIIQNDENILKKVHSAMKEQWEAESFEGFEVCPVNEIEEQLHQTEEAFYLKHGKIYIQFSILTGAGFYDFVSFDIEKI